MSVISTKAIVLNSLKYRDTSLIVKCFTEQEGVKSYLLKGVLVSKKGKVKPAYFQPLTQLQLTANHHRKNSLNSIREVQVIHPYETVFKSIVKQSIILFLSEVLSNIIREEEENRALYRYLETSLIWLDTHQSTANFHLLFLLNLARFLGFYPDITEIEKPAFSLLEGKFTNTTYEKLLVTGGELVLFKKLLGINFDVLHTISFSKNERQTVLKMLIQYFELHLSGFKQPKSLSVLEAVFN